ncbi:F0F1 ATP synthase subunit gamma [Methylocapsa palsarum]|uniref:F-type H+-transporting ATPase subunit gamma n=1 Tax=Methylocapsa palsarum TaxID=1612308 RepID=A0A1I4CUY5_9HYPH|nr:F0F1 ATP synthase subunit gamma [Methylocapsa palsarum]SFK84139.1 F-type H+-transporting ATPase subunit gamma [Methylocapsa palsarum]
MSETLEGLRRKIDGAAELEAVVRTMKALAASSIGQYERATHALDDYFRTVQLGFVAYFRQTRSETLVEERASTGPISAYVFGSDQGLVGRFNDVLADSAATTLAALPGKKRVWAVGERIETLLADSGLPSSGLLPAPNSVVAVTGLVGRILLEIDAHREHGKTGQVYLFYNRRKSSAAYEPVSRRLLPLDDRWRRALIEMPWPTGNLPQVIEGGEATLRALLSEYLFVSLFRACMESLASENASRLAAMQRAEKNIDKVLEELSATFHRLRQNAIDDELFDVISGYEALRGGNREFSRW